MPDIIGLFNTAAAVCDETEVFRVAIAKRHYNKGTVEGLRSAIAHLKVVETADLCLLIGTLETLMLTRQWDLNRLEVGLQPYALPGGGETKRQLRPYQQACEYLGHHGTSGLQQHSIGDEYPFVIYGVGAADGTKKWAVLNGATGWYSDKRHDTYQQAQSEIKEIAA